MRGTDEVTCILHMIDTTRRSTWQQVQRMLYFDAEEPNAPLDKVFLAGATAGVTQCAIATPMELVRSKLQVQNRGEGKAYAGNIDCLKRVYASEGLPGLYRGNISMMAREAPGFGVYFSVYEATKRALCPGLGKNESPPMWVEAVGGATTGAVTWTVVMPVDVISTRVSNVLSLAAACSLRMRSWLCLLLTSQDGASSTRFRTSLKAACTSIQIQCTPEETAAEAKTVRYNVRAVWQEAGLRGFYRGLGPAVLRGVVLNTAVFPVYESVVRALS